jgi:prophage regulatory protein
LRLPDVIKTVGLRRASIYQYVREGRFPKPVRLGERGVGWVEAEIQAWIAERIAQRPGVDTAAAATDTRPVLTPSEPQPGYFISAEEYSELQRLRRLEGRAQSLPRGAADSRIRSRPRRIG